MGEDSIIKSAFETRKDESEIWKNTVICLRLFFHHLEDQFKLRVMNLNIDSTML